VYWGFGVGFCLGVRGLEVDKEGVGYWRLGVDFVLGVVYFSVSVLIEYP
jgi:hypothetical protein